MLHTLRQLNRKFLPEHYLFPPAWIVLGVNNVCNLHCKMCDVGTQSTETNFAQNLVGTHPINMPPELITRVIDQTASYYPNAQLGYAFTEPLVYPHLEASLQHAKARGLKASITTNALVLKQKAAMLANAELDNLFVSLDGPQDIHNEIRGHARSFQKAIDGIEEMLRLRPEQSVSVFCVITEWNIGHLHAFVRFFEKYPLKQLGLMHTNFTPQAVADTHNLAWHHAYPATVSNVASTNIDNYDLDLLWQEIRSVKAMKLPFQLSFSPEIATKEKLLEFYLQPKKLIGRTCHDIFSSLMIKSDGSVIPAHGRCYNVTVGNIYENNLAEIWTSSVYNKFRKDVMRAGGLLPACSRCCSSFSD